MLERPVLVTVDGVDGSGKTTFADELAAHVGGAVRRTVFTQGDELTAYWDLAVFLDVPFVVSVSRMARRDGSPDDVSHPDQARYVDGQRMYFARCRPWTRADVIVDNSNLNDPRILREVHHERAARPGGHRPRTVR